MFLRRSTYWGKRLAGNIFHPRQIDHLLVLHRPSEMKGSKSWFRYHGDNCLAWRLRRNPPQVRVTNDKNSVPRLFKLYFKLLYNSNQQVISNHTKYPKKVLKFIWNTCIWKLLVKRNCWWNCSLDGPISVNFETGKIVFGVGISGNFLCF